MVYSFVWDRRRLAALRWGWGWSTSLSIVAMIWSGVMLDMRFISATAESSVIACVVSTGAGLPGISLRLIGVAERARAMALSANCCGLGFGVGVKRLPVAAL